MNSHKLLTRHQLSRLLIVFFGLFFLLGGGEWLTQAWASAGAAGGEEGEPSALSKVLISLIVIILAAKLGGELMERFGQPAVLGELLFGLIIGNLTIFFFHQWEFLREIETIGILAEIGVILLLFEVGLESNLKEMMSVGLSSLLVAVVGVIAPFILGIGASWIFFPDEVVYMHIYLGVVLVATSVGITARVLSDMRKLQTKEAKIILGAAVIDDVLGLIVLAVVVGVIRGAAGAGAGDASLVMDTLLIVVKAVLFFAGAILFGLYVSPHLFRVASFLRVRGMLLATALLVCFLFSYVAEMIGLATIVGAFAAGLTLDDVHYREFTNRGEAELGEALKPLTGFLVPIFFVHMGMSVNLSSANSSILLFAVTITLLAIAGKQVCALGVLQKGVDRITVGLGMIPRGEVGLIVASLGLKLAIDGEPVVSEGVFAAAVIMIMVTTMMTPPLLKWRMGIVDERKRLAMAQDEV